MELYAIQLLNIPTRSIFLAIPGKDFWLTDAAHSCALKLIIKAGPFLVFRLDLLSTNHRIQIHSGVEGGVRGGEYDS